MSFGGSPCRSTSPLMTGFTPDGATVEPADGVDALDVGVLGWLGPEQAHSARSESTEATPQGTSVLRLRVDMRADLSFGRATVRATVRGSLGSMTYQVGA